MSVRQKVRWHLRKLRRRIGRFFAPVFGKLYIRSKLWRRVSYGVIGAFVILASVLLQSLWPLFRNNNYELSPEALRLVGEVRDDAADYLKMNEDKTAYEFTVPDTTDEASVQTGRVEDAFSASFSVDPKQGVTVTEKTTRLPIRLVPKFYVGDGKQIEGDRIVYPSGSSQLVYSLKYNGLKEDIIIPAPGKDELDHAFELVLPNGVEARLDSDGNIGIYTSDQTLYGDISYGTEEDRALVEKARENSDKNNRILTIPAPIIKDVHGTEYTDRSTFELGERKQRQDKASVQQDIPEEVKQQAEQKSTHNIYNLSIVSKNLKELAYPISIDPTMQVTAAADFAGTDFEPGVQPDYTNGLIRRGELTGGVLNSWATTNALPTVRLWQQTVAYNGYLYLLGGDNTGGGGSTVNNTVHYAKVNSNGTIASDSGCGSSWCATTSFTTARRDFAATVYNGYMYIAGGTITGSAITDGTEYAKINTDGTIGTWSSGSVISSVRRSLSLVATNGYLYTHGGVTTGGTNTTSSQYARLNADGSFASDSGCGSSWCSATVLPASRAWHAATVYNGSLYIIGGGQGGSVTAQSTVYYARIASNGSLGSWTTTATLGTARLQHSAFVWNGYVYASGGCTLWSPGCGGYLGSTEYAPINSNGSLGTWRTTKSLVTARNQASSAVWNGYLYVLGGCSTGNCSGYLSSVEYTSIKPAGELHDASWGSATVLPASYSYIASEAYNGYIYAVGGWSNTLGYLNVVRHAPINQDGTIGSWTTSANTLGTARRSHDTAIYNGFLYVAGGTNSGGNPMASIEYAQINSDGTIGSFTSAANPFPTTRSGLQFSVYNGWAYLMGGSPTGTASSDEVYKSAVASDGSLGTWSSAGVMNGDRTAHSMFLHNGYMYVVSGGNATCASGQSVSTVEYAQIDSNGDIPSNNWGTSSSPLVSGCDRKAVVSNGYIYLAGGTDTSGTYLDQVEYAPINTDGTVGTWTATTSLPAVRALNPGVVAYNGFLYVLGGNNGSSHTNTVYYAAINNGGQGGSGTWTQDAGGNFTTSRKNHAAVAYNGYLYVLGGCSNSACSTTVNTTYYAPINDDGSVGTWAATTTTFTTARMNHYAFVYNGRMYVLGGRASAGGAYNTTIYYSPIDSNGNITTAWTNNATAIPATDLEPGMALNGNILYMLGGSASETTTRYATIDTSTGAVGSWSTSTALPSGGYQMWAVVHKGYIYAIGGNSASGRKRSAYFAPLNSNNTIGTWVETSQLGDALNSTSTTAAFAANGYIYAIGGQNGTGFYNGVQFAAVQANGYLGPWQSAGAYSALGAHGNAAVATYRGVAYMTGGQITGTDPQAETRYAALKAIPRIGTFSKAHNFGSGIRPGKLIGRGVKQTGANITMGYAISTSCTGTFGSQTAAGISLGGDNAITVSLGSGVTLAQCIRLVYTLDDQAGSTFPDSSNASYISDFDLYFTANPDSRLRGGRSFINGQDRGLGANPN